MPTEWNRNNPEKARAHRKKWREAHPGYGPMKARERSERLRKALFALLGDKCVRCGFSDHRALQVDHRHGGGKKEVNSFPSRWKYYQKILADPNAQEMYQILCANCNWIKRHENSEL